MEQPALHLWILCLDQLCQSPTSVSTIVCSGKVACPLPCFPQTGLWNPAILPIVIFRQWGIHISDPRAGPTDLVDAPLRPSSGKPTGSDRQSRAGKRRETTEILAGRRILVIALLAALAGMWSSGGVVAGRPLQEGAGSRQEMVAAETESRVMGSSSAFVGSDTCRGCHPSHNESWRKDTGHSCSVRPAARGDLSAARADLSLPGAPPVDRRDWTWVVGGWSQGEAYVFTDAEGRLLVSPYRYDLQRKRFDLRKDRGGNPELLDWGQECSGCHVTGWDPQKRRGVDAGVACEGCHGAGAGHVQSPNSARLPARADSSSCGVCHVQGGGKKCRFIGDQ